MKLILEAIKSMFREVENKFANIPQSDWNQNDENAIDHVKNRPFYTAITDLSSNNITGQFSGNFTIVENVMTYTPDQYFEIGQLMTVVWNGVEYTCIVRLCDYLGLPGIGNFSLYYNGYENTGEPFAIICLSENRCYVAVGEDSTVNATWKLTIPGVLVNFPIPEKYMPASITGGIYNAQATADSAYNFAEILNGNLSKKMQKSNPAGDGSFTLNTRKQNSSVGDMSVTMGTSLSARRKHMIAVGRYNKDDTDSYGLDIAFGVKTPVRFDKKVWIVKSYSIDQNTGKITYEYEDNYITAAYISNFPVIVNTHTVNNEPSTGNPFFLDGSVEDDYFIGREVICKKARDSEGEYAFVVGNGTSDSERSNAHTLDWNGLGWFAGGLKVGGTGQDDENAKEVATKDDKLSNPNALTFTGAVTGTYDGSAPMTVEIPTGGGGSSEWELLTDITLSEESAIAPITYDTKYREMYATLTVPKVDATISTGNQFKFLHGYGLYYASIGNTSYPYIYQLRCEKFGETLYELFCGRPQNGVGQQSQVNTRNGLATPKEPFTCGGTLVFPAETRLVVYGRE